MGEPAPEQRRTASPLQLLYFGLIRQLDGQAIAFRRQKRAIENFSRCRCSRQCVGFDDGGDIVLQPRVADAVSYTHLDVYKRQAQHPGSEVDETRGQRDVSRAVCYGRPNAG